MNISVEPMSSNIKTTDSRGDSDHSHFQWNNLGPAKIDVFREKLFSCTDPTFSHPIKKSDMDLKLNAGLKAAPSFTFPVS